MSSLRGRYASRFLVLMVTPTFCSCWWAPYFGFSILQEVVFQYPANIMTWGNIDPPLTHLVPGSMGFLNRCRHDFDVLARQRLVGMLSIGGMRVKPEHPNRPEPRNSTPQCPSLGAVDGESACSVCPGIMQRRSLWIVHVHYSRTERTMRTWSGVNCTLTSCDVRWPAR